MPPTKVDATHAWHCECHVQARVEAELLTKGYSISRLADTHSREHGVDINGPDLKVSVKGFPGKNYVRGPKIGTPKTTSVHSQARQYFSHATLDVVLYRSEHPTALVALGLPRMTTYLELWRKSKPVFKNNSIQAIFVDQTGVITWDP